MTATPALPTSPATVESPPSTAAAARTWPFAVTAAVLVALVVGVLVGRLLADGRDGPAAPQVVHVEDRGGAAAPAPSAPAPSGGAE